jgi:hypothetical protein
MLTSQFFIVPCAIAVAAVGWNLSGDLSIGLHQLALAARVTLIPATSLKFGGTGPSSRTAIG